MTREMRLTLVSILERLGGDGVTLGLNEGTAEQFSDAIFEIARLHEERAALEERAQIVRWLKGGSPSITAVEADVRDRIRDEDAVGTLSCVYAVAIEHGAHVTNRESSNVPDSTEDKPHE